MKGANRKIIIGSLFFLSMFLLSCKFETNVYYESEELTQRKTQEDRFLNSFDNTKICTRILTTISSEIVFLKFSKKNIFNDIVIEDLMIKDDTGKVLITNLCITLSRDKGKVSQESNQYFYDVYSFSIPSDIITREQLKEYKTKFFVISYKIDGVEYMEKLKKLRKKYLVTRT